MVTLSFMTSFFISFCNLLLVGLIVGSLIGKNLQTKKLWGMCNMQGDGVEIVIVNREGIRHELMDLKRD
jgi:hypothetical protein